MAFVIPQINGTVKGLLVVAAIGTVGALQQSYHADILTGWDTLIPALKAGSFQGFIAALGATSTWLAVRSPLSQASHDDKNLVKTVEEMTGIKGAAAVDTAKQVKEMAQNAAIQQVVNPKL